MENNQKIIECETKGLSYEHFGIPAHKYIYNAMMYLYAKKQTPTPISITEVITIEEGKKALEEIGGLQYLCTLTDNYINSDNLSIFCSKVMQSYVRRMVFQICMETQDELIKPKTETLNESEIISMVETKINDLSVNVLSNEEIYKMGKNVEERLALRALTPASVPGLELGWAKLDSYTGGMRPNDLWFVCARSKCGKSTLLTNWAVEIGIIQQLPVLYIDTEMTSEEQEDRILSILTGIPQREIETGLYAIDTENGTKEEKRALLDDAKKKLSSSKYYHVYMPNFTIEKVNAITKKYKKQHGIVALFFDYLKLPASQGNALRSSQEYQLLGFMASGLKDIAGTLEIPVISACQENRSDVEGTEKNASNVGGSDRILQLATKLLFLYNKSDEMIGKQGILNGNQQLYIAYQRNGQSECPPINIMFNRPILKQTEV